MIDEQKELTRIINNEKPMVYKDMPIEKEGVATEIASCADKQYFSVRKGGRFVSSYPPAQVYDEIKLVVAGHRKDVSEDTIVSELTENPEKAKMRFTITKNCTKVLDDDFEVTKTSVTEIKVKLTKVDENLVVVDFTQVDGQKVYFHEQYEALYKRGLQSLDNATL